jgi:hypothetical protein
MQGLNDIDEKIIEKEFLIELISLLDEKEHLSFYGFYIRFIRYSINKIKLAKEKKDNTDSFIPKNLILLLSTLIRVNFFNYLLF